MQYHCIVRSTIFNEWESISIGQIWHIGRFFVQNDIYPSFMTIYMRKCMIIMFCRQMKLRYWSQKRIEPPEKSITYGSTESESCIETSRSFYMSISLPVMSVIPETFLKIFRELPDRWISGLSCDRKRTGRLENRRLLDTRKTPLC